MKIQGYIERAVFLGGSQGMALRIERFQTRPAVLKSYGHIFTEFIGMAHYPVLGTEIQNPIF